MNPFSSDRVGIVRWGRALAWGVNHGALMSWPYWIKKLIVKVWNRAGCTLLGHEMFKDQCIHCPKGRHGRKVPPAHDV